MPKQKKQLKNKMTQPGRRQSTGNRHSRGEVKKKPYFIGFLIATATVAVAVLLLFWLIVDSTKNKGEQAYPPPGELRETTPVAWTTLDFTESQYGIEMAHVRGGTFLMGCTPEHGDDCYDYEDTVSLVTVSDFYIGKYEVTQAQWEAVMGNNPSVFKGDNLPVENISWDDAQEFIGKLNAATDREYRLPTEAEWEYAARGGRQTRGYRYSGSNNVEEIAWYDGNSGNRTHPVGTKKANELGIHDMSGNVWEWVSDWVGDHDGAPRKDPKGPNEGAFRIIRGGGWGSYARGVRVSNYFNNDPGYHYNILGLRLALTFQGKTN